MVDGARNSLAEAEKGDDKTERTHNHTVVPVSFQAWVTTIVPVVYPGELMSGIIGGCRLRGNFVCMSAVASSLAISGDENIREGAPRRGSPVLKNNFKLTPRR